MPLKLRLRIVYQVLSFHTVTLNFFILWCGQSLRLKSDYKMLCNNECMLVFFFTMLLQKGLH